MSEQKRYSDGTRMTGRLTGQVRDVLVACLGSSDEVKDFVEKNLGRSVLSRVSWNKALNYSCMELVNLQISHSQLGVLIEKLQVSKPDSKELSELVAYLVDAGYLNDSQVPAPVTNRRSDWVSRFPTDLVGLDGPNRAIFIDAIAESVGTVAALDRLLADSFTDEYSNKIRNDLDRTSPIKTNVEHALSGFENLNRMNAFLLAVQDTDKNNPILFFAAASILDAFRPKPVTPTSAPATTPAAAPAATPAVAAATTQTTTAAPKGFQVTRVLTTLTAEQVGLVSKMITSCFGSHDMDNLCHLYTGEQLDDIVAKGPLRKMAEDLLRWCEQQRDKLVPLLNGMVKERPGRPDLKELFRKLAAAGAIEIEE